MAENMTTADNIMAENMTTADNIMAENMTTAAVSYTHLTLPTTPYV